MFSGEIHYVSDYGQYIIELPTLLIRTELATQHISTGTYIVKEFFVRDPQNVYYSLDVVLVALAETKLARVQIPHDLLEHCVAYVSYRHYLLTLRLHHTRFKHGAVLFA